MVLLIHEGETFDIAEREPVAVGKVIVLHPPRSETACSELPICIVLSMWSVSKFDSALTS